MSDVMFLIEAQHSSLSDCRSVEDSRESSRGNRMHLQAARQRLLRRHSINLHFHRGRRVTCSVSPGTRHDVESDQPGFLEPADTAAIDRAAGSRLVSVTKGPKCAAFSLFLSFSSLSFSPFPRRIRSPSRRSLSHLAGHHGRIRFFGDLALKR